ncbi:hypothetical protein WJX73_001025 [Symbiochloris irregularis]|uniref:Nicotinate-nucleotide pyrophosphorylase [carboxylating] n=1 Tax=Symbiochloris irregularis TaxID=706552 RepID=A0AAW1PFS8_9CHLO
MNGSDGSQQWRQPWEGSANPPYAPIPPPPHPTFDLDQAILGALREDSGVLGDVTTQATVDKDMQAEGTFLAKGDGVLAGLAVAQRVFELMAAGLQVSWSSHDGAEVTKGTRFGTVRGPAWALLTAERIALNYMQRMSGIATLTAAMAARIKGHRAKLLETRKTVPGLRVLDKWAVLAGGGANHRQGLFDMVMIKDNHVTAAGGITAAVRRTQAYFKQHNLSLPVEVETRTLAEVREVIGLLEASGGSSSIQRVMLDNMARADPAAEGGVDVSLLAEAQNLIGDRVDTEASGNVTIDTVEKIASTGVTFISCGGLTHSVAALDISLKIKLSEQ